MKINFSNNSLKFLDKIDERDKERIRLKIKGMVKEIEMTGTIPFAKLNIKKLEGEWKGFFRMRSGKMRIIFNLDRKTDEMNIYEIDFRGNVYR